MESGQGNDTGLHAYPCSVWSGIHETGRVETARICHLCTQALTGNEGDKVRIWLIVIGRSSLGSVIYLNLDLAR
jgi:hypothetical protein